MPERLDTHLLSPVPQPDPQLHVLHSSSPSRPWGTAPHEQPEVFTWCHRCVPQCAKWRGITTALDLLPLPFPSHPVWGQSGTHQLFLLYDNNKCVFSFSIK